MTVVHTFQRYEAVACMDREDADALGKHLMAIADALTNGRARLDLNGHDHQLELHVARLVRIVQRATQPDVMGRSPCAGVEKLIQTIDDGKRLITVRTARADIVFDLMGARRTVTLEDRGPKVVDMAAFRQKCA